MRAFAVLCFLVLGSAGLTAEPKPLPQAHAHNDYEHSRPLFDALDQGFCSVEADIYLVDGKLLVAHNRADVKPRRTLAALYLDPLRDQVRRNGGRLYRDGPAAILLVDLKSEAGPTYAALHAELARYAEMLTVFRGGKREPGAITVIISGNRPTQDVAAQPIRYAAVDGRAGDLQTNPPATLVPLISENWNNVFGWRWAGEMPAAERDKLQRWVEQAHAQGRQVRFWNTPDRPATWQLLREASVDLIGTDHLAELAKFLNAAAR
jgi:hypothetical protein